MRWAAACAPSAAAQPSWVAAALALLPPLAPRAPSRPWAPSGELPGRRLSHQPVIPTPYSHSAPPPPAASLASAIQPPHAFSADAPTLSAHVPLALPLALAVHASAAAATAATATTAAPTAALIASAAYATASAAEGAALASATAVCRIAILSKCRYTTCTWYSRV